MLASTARNGLIANEACSRMEREDAALLIRAAKNDNAAEIRTLVQAGVAVDAADANGRTALSWAVKIRNVCAALALVESGANAEAEAKNGWTPMALAVKSGSPAIIAIAMQGLDRPATAPAG